MLALVMALVCGANYVHAEGDKPSTADRHKTHGIECEGCHKDKDKTLFDYKQCLSCHESYEKVAERTKKLERNPHKSHYHNLPCTTCHHGHKPDENFCAPCHPDYHDPIERKSAMRKYLGSALLCLVASSVLFISKY
jgi:hypothetical protein